MLKNEKILNLLKLKSENDLNKTDKLVEMCKQYEEDLEGYAIVVPSENEEELVEIMSGGNKLAMSDFRSKLKISSSLQQILVNRICDVEDKKDKDDNDDNKYDFDSITELLMHRFDCYQNVLNHYGIEVDMEEVDEDTYGSPFSEGINSLNTDDMDEMHEEVEEMEEPVYDEEIKEENHEDELVYTSEINQPFEESTDHKEVDYNEEADTEECEDDTLNVSKSDYNKLLLMLQLVCDKIGLSYDELVEEAELVIESKNNPYLELGEVEVVLSLLEKHNKVDESLKSFVLTIYKQGNIKEVTDLLNGLIEECMKEGIL
ncbi:hypothetical protein [Paraclostridium bifermentans]|uniref:hypothetical protein n=1 Tax=Paraclostridium bifermentans TaxID=1490 RepID=UPI00374E4DF6